MKVRFLAFDPDDKDNPRFIMEINLVDALDLAFHLKEFIMFAVIGDTVGRIVFDEEGLLIINTSNPASEYDQQFFFGECK